MLSQSGKLVGLYSLLFSSDIMHGLALFYHIFLPSYLSKKTWLCEIGSKTKRPGNVWFSLEDEIFWKWKVYIPMRFCQDQGYAQKEHIEVKTFLWYSYFLWSVHEYRSLGLFILTEVFILSIFFFCLGFKIFMIGSTERQLMFINVLPQMTWL